MKPPVAARPKACSSWFSSPQVTPPSTRAVRATGSIRTDFMRERSMTRPPSHIELPATLWPAPRTATSSSCERAKFTALITSATPAQRTIKSGRRSIIALKILRAVS
jgi:hypothetical protein